MIDYIKKYIGNSLIISIVLLIFAVFLIAQPAVSILSIISVFGWILLIDGIMHVLSYWGSPVEHRVFNFEFIQGVLFMVIGLLISFNTDMVAELLPLLVGIWIIVSSLMRFQLAINMGTIKKESWTTLLIMSILTFLLGMYMLANPMAAGVALVVTVGAVLLVVEIIHILEYIIIYSKLGEVAKVAKATTKTQPKVKSK